MLSLFFKGGIVMYPILLCSVFALAIFMERVFALRAGNVLPAGLFEEVASLLKEGKIDQATALCGWRASALARVLLAGLKHHSGDRQRIRQAIEDEAEHEAGKLERFIDYLATIASVSTLLGLLGTIAGMIKVFSVISTQAMVNPPALAAGISEALITTFAGLSVAIPTLVMHRLLQGRLEGSLRKLEAISLALLDLLDQQPEKDVRAVS